MTTSPVVGARFSLARVGKAEPAAQELVLAAFLQWPGIPARAFLVPLRPQTFSCAERRIIVPTIERAAIKESRSSGQ